jgi:hypothetical protein
MDAQLPANGRCAKMRDADHRVDLAYRAGLRRFRRYLAAHAILRRPERTRRNLSIRRLLGNRSKRNVPSQCVPELILAISGAARLSDHAARSRPHGRPRPMQPPPFAAQFEERRSGKPRQLPRDTDRGFLHVSGRAASRCGSGGPRHRASMK